MSTRHRLLIGCLAALLGCTFGCSKPQQSEETPSRPVASPGAKSRGLRPLEPIAGVADYRRRFAVIIGIDEYPGGRGRLGPLRFAVNDAREFRKTLRDEFGYSGENTLYLVNRDATRKRIQDAIAGWLPKQKLHRHDSLLVFFAGHGLVQSPGKRGYLAAVDSVASDLEGSCIGVCWIRDRLAELPCRHKLVILDSCYSGSLFQNEAGGSGAGQLAADERAGGVVSDQRAAALPGDGASRGPDSSTASDNLSYYLSQPAFLGISAGRLSPVSDGSGESEHSVFTAALLEVLRQRADSPREDHAFTFRQVAAQVETRVANALGSRQIPDWGRLGPGDGDFLFRPTVGRLTPRQLSQRQTYVKQIAQAKDAWQRGDITSAERFLDDCSAELRGWEWRYLKRRSHRDRLTLGGHTAEVNCVAFSKDGNWIASGGGVGMQPGELMLYDARTGREVHSFDGHPLMVTGLAFSGRGNRLASVGWDGTLAVWDIDRRRRLLSVDTQQGRLYAVAMSLDGKWIATAGEDKHVRLWEAESGRPARSFGPHRSAVRCVAFGGRRLASGSEAGVVIVWNWPNGDRPLRLTGPPIPVVGVAFDTDGNRLASAHRDGTFIVWDTATGKQLSSRRHPGQLQSIALSPDGKQLALGSRDHCVYLYRVESGLPPHTLRGHAGPVLDVAFSHDGRQLASAGADAAVKVWDMDAKPDCLVFRRHDGWVNDVALAPGGRLVASVSEDGVLKLWDPENGRVLQDIPAHDVAARCVAFSHDGRRLATGGADRKVKLWDPQQGTELLVLEGFGGTVNRVAISADGKIIAASADKTARIWDSGQGKPLLTFRGHTHSVNGLALGPGGVLVFSAASATFKRTEPEWKLWRAATGEEILAFTLDGQTAYVQDAAYSSDGKWLASAGPDNELRLWEARSGRLVFQNRPQQPNPQKQCVTAVAFSPGGHRLASAGSDGTIKIWDTMSGLMVLSLDGPDKRATAVAFDPDGNRLAAAGRDKTVRIWTAKKSVGCVATHPAN